MTAETTRVYHPELNTWYDVTNPDEWAEQGWRKTKPAHVDDSADPKPGPAPKSTPKTAKERRAATKRTGRSLQQQAAASGAGTLE